MDDNINTVAEARTLDSRDRKVGHWNAWAKESGFEPFAEWVEGDKAQRARSAGDPPPLLVRPRHCSRTPRETA